MGETIEQDLEPYWNADRGSAAAAELDAPIINYYFYVVRGRQVFMGFRSDDHSRVRELIPLIKQTASQFPGTIAVAKQSSLFERGLTGGRTIDIEITGPRSGNPGGAGHAHPGGSQTAAAGSAGHAAAESRSVGPGDPRPTEAGRGVGNGRYGRGSGLHGGRARRRCVRRRLLHGRRQDRSVDRGQRVVRPTDPGSRFPADRDSGPASWFRWHRWRTFA